VHIAAAMTFGSVVCSKMTTTIFEDFIVKKLLYSRQ